MIIISIIIIIIIIIKIIVIIVNSKNINNNHENNNCNQCNNYILQYPPTCLITQPCLSNPCFNGATCLVSADSSFSFTCQCAANFTGTFCESGTVGLNFKDKYIFFNYSYILHA